MDNFSIQKKDVDLLLKKFSILEIESALIIGFLKENKIECKKNLLIKKILKQSNSTSFEIQKILEEKTFEFSLKNIERFFELLIPINDRSINGAFYTPDLIVKYIVNKLILDNQTICDPSCGSGAFLVASVEKIFSITSKSIVHILEDNIFGADILDYNISRTKIILTLLALKNGEDVSIIKFNLHHGDSLKINWCEIFPKIFLNYNLGSKNTGFDVVLGNPPYVRIQDLNENLKTFLSENYITVNGGNFNLYFAFFELGISLLKTKGQLGYIVPNSFFTSFAAQNLRNWFQEKRFLKEIIDFTHLLLFEDALTYTCIAMLDKSEKKDFLYNYIDSEDSLKTFSKQKSDSIKFDEINSKKWRLLKRKDLKNIQKIENCGTPLGFIAKINSGIATLKDELYFVDENQKIGNYYAKIFSGKKYKISEKLVKKVIKISDMNSNSDVENNSRRIIFPYVKADDKFKIISEDELIKNNDDCYNYFLAIKEELAKRDKGNKQYVSWYAYGRGQGFEIKGKKLLTPTFSKKPKFMLDSDGDSFFCNGYALSNSQLDLEILQKILNSSVMDYYITRTSVQIGGGYPCFQKNFIEKFNIPEFDKKELIFLKKENNQEKINSFLEKKYSIKI